MLTLSFVIVNPWSDRRGIISNWHKMLIGMWAWDCTVYRTNQLLALEFETRLRTDHEGLRLVVGLFGYSLEFCVYNRMHWKEKRRKKSKIEENHEVR